ncbi:hypothetical protein PVK06_024559 [Gossypium arboreum]|uniref:Uncharacterized protein n=1 Tax=Gossypium arboreum TaxID=29729 RepID=A0ABR0PE93_GOSAR|nr:hypothetical protein PVK06_024559 [Gossypium arboreum]
MKVIGSGMNTNVTLPHGTYLSYIFTKLGISTHGDTPVTSNQHISYGALYHLGYHFDAAINTWINHEHLVDNEDDDVDAAFDNVLVPNPATPPTSSSLHAA